MRLNGPKTVLIFALIASPCVAQDIGDGSRAKASSSNQESTAVEKPQPTESNPTRVLQSAIDGMNQSLKDFRQQEVSQQTLKTQAAVVSSLDELIRLSKSMQPNKQSGSGGKPNPDASDKKPKNNSKDGKSDKPNGAQQEQSQQRKRADDQQDSNGPTKGSVPATEGMRSARGILVKEVWGHLPPALRRRLLQTAEEKPIPQYQGLVEQYFRAIAERPSRQKQSKPAPRPRK